MSLPSYQLLIKYNIYDMPNLKKLCLELTWSHIPRPNTNFLTTIISKKKVSFFYFFSFLLQNYAITCENYIIQHKLRLETLDFHLDPPSFPITNFNTNTRISIPQISWHFQYREKSQQIFNNTFEAWSLERLDLWSKDFIFKKYFLIKHSG